MLMSARKRGHGFMETTISFAAAGCAVAYAIAMILIARFAR
jgi:hypothetical protein